MKKITLLAVSALIGFSVESFARDQIKIVGSSTVYPLLLLWQKDLVKQVDLRHL